MARFTDSRSREPELVTVIGPAATTAPAVAGGRRLKVGSHAGLICGVTILVLLAASSVLVGVLRPYSTTEISGIPFSGPDAAHWLGTDQLGRDTFVRLCVAARASLLISFLAAAISAVVGSVIGLVAGLYGGWVESALMAVTELFLAIPSILVALCAVTAFGSSITTLVLVLAFVAVPQFAQLVRGRCLELREQDFIQSAKVSGVSTIRIAFQHMLPNCQFIIAVQLANTAAISILLEAALSYLGLSVQPPTPSWGQMIFASQDYMTRTPSLALAPAAAILLASVGWGLIGEAFSTSRRSAI
jgi:peptide/nickel transport system permease protein